MRYLMSIFAAIALASPALAQVNCLPMTVVTPYATGAIQFVGYNSDTLNMVAGYRQQPTTNVAYQPVPKTIANRLVGMTTADPFFSANIAPNYHEGILTEARNEGFCPILNENGNWIWSH